MITETTLQQVEIKRIKLTGLNPRKDFDKEGLKELAATIEVQGIIEPLIVREKGKNYELVAGERRLRAAKIAKLKTVPVIVRVVDDTELMELMLLENLQREDLLPFEEGTALVHLLTKTDISQAEIAKRVGKSPGWVSARVRMLELPANLQRMHKEGHLGIESLVLMVKYVEYPKFLERIHKELDDTSHYRDYHQPSHVKDAFGVALGLQSYAIQVGEWQYGPDWYHHFDRKECKKCDKVIKAPTRYGSSLIKFCLKTSCYRPKMTEAKKAVKTTREKLAEEGKAGSAEGGVVDLSRKAGDKWVKLSGNLGYTQNDPMFKTSVCNGCKDKVKATDNGSKGTACLKPGCFNTKQMKAKEEIQRLQDLNSQTIKDNMAHLVDKPPKDATERLLRILLSTSISRWNNDTNKLALAPWFKKTPKNGWVKALDKIPAEDLPIAIIRLRAVDLAQDASRGRGIEEEAIAERFPELMEGVQAKIGKIKVR